MEKVKISRVNKGLVNPGDYQGLLHELKGIIVSGQCQAYKAIDNIKVQTYWQIGERIVREELKNKDRAEYGKYLINQLSVDLGIEHKLMYRIVRFYSLSNCRIADATIELTHYYSLMDIEDNKEPNFMKEK